MSDRDPSTALGETIRAQRQLSQLPMRTLAERVGISNPYLSQIERGLRAPSDQVLDSIARALMTTSRALYEAAGLTPPGREADVPDPAVLIALREDTLLSDNQRRALAAVYRAFTEGKAPMRRRRRRRLAPAPADVAAAAVEAADAAAEAAAAADAAAVAGAAVAAAAEAVVASGHEPDTDEADTDTDEAEDAMSVTESRTGNEPEKEPG